jgi:predicted component of type VI protein secretion system
MAFTESLGGYVGSGRDATWTVNDNIVTIGNSIFTIEGDDLTDSKGNRWVRMH